MGLTLLIIFYTRKNPKDYYEKVVKIAGIEREEWYWWVAKYPYEARIEKKYSEINRIVVPLVYYDKYSNRLKKCVTDEIRKLDGVREVEIYGNIPYGNVELELTTRKIFGSEYYVVSVVASYEEYCVQYYGNSEFEMNDEGAKLIIEFEKRLAEDKANAYTNQLLDVVRKIILLTEPDFGYGDSTMVLDRYLKVLENEEVVNVMKMTDYLDSLPNYEDDEIETLDLPWLFVVNEKIFQKLSWKNKVKHRIKEKIGNCLLFVEKIPLE